MDPAHRFADRRAPEPTTAVAARPSSAGARPRRLLPDRRAAEPCEAAQTVNKKDWRRGRDLNPRHRDYPCTAFPVPHLRPLGHPSACSPEQPSRVLRPNVERRSPATAVAARPSSRGALRTLAGCPPDRRAPEPCAGAPTPIQLAEGRGFEPPRGLRPYPISSRTPSNGLRHPSP